MRLQVLSRWREMRWGSGSCVRESVSSVWSGLMHDSQNPAICIRLRHFVPSEQVCISLSVSVMIVYPPCRQEIEFLLTLVCCFRNHFLPLILLRANKMLVRKIPCPVEVTRVLFLYPSSHLNSNPPHVRASNSQNSFSCFKDYELKLKLVNNLCLPRELWVLRQQRDIYCGWNAYEHRNNRRGKLENTEWAFHWCIYS